MSTPRSRLIGGFILVLAAISFFIHARVVSLGAVTNPTVFFPLILIDEPPAWIGPPGGSVVAIAADPSDPDVVYAGSWGAGVFKSTNGGVTWHPSNQGLENQYIVSLAIDPLDPSILYAGTYKNKLYKSTDAGQSWVLSSEGIQDEAIVYTIAINPRNPSILYIGTRGVSNNGGPPWNGVVYRSVDGGVTWEPKLKDIGGVNQQDWVYSLNIHPNAADWIFAATHEHGAFRSKDNGINWQSINSGISDLSGRSILVDPQSTFPAVVYMGVWHDIGVYKSTNNGYEWFPQNKGIIGSKIYAMAIDPTQTDTLYLATFNQGIVMTSDGGDRWTGSGLASEKIYSIVINPQDSHVLYSGTSNNGLFRSIDGGSTWSHSQAGLIASSVTSLVDYQGDTSAWYAGLYGGGVARSTDQGSTWSDYNTGLGEKYVQALVMDPAQEGILYALTDNGGLYRRDINTDAGWVSASSGLPAPPSIDVVSKIQHPLLDRDSIDDLIPETSLEKDGVAASQTYVSLHTMVFAPTDPQIAYIGTGGAGVYKRTESSNAWVPAGLPDETVWSLAVDPLDANILYAATGKIGSVRFSTDGGDTWGDINLPGLSIYSLSLSPANPETLYVGTNDGVHCYSGETWEPAGLSGETVSKIAAHPTLPNVIFAGTTNGTFVSSDGGMTWTSGPEELTNMSIQSIDFSPQDEKVVYFGTLTHGALRAYVKAPYQPNGR